MHHIAWAALLLLLSTAACGTEIEGIKLPERVRLGAESALVLNGAGVRVRFIFVKVYVAALYLPAKAGDGEAILKSEQPRRLFLHMLRDLSAEQINSSIEDALRDTLTAEERQPLDARMATFTAIFGSMREVRQGTQIAIDYLPQIGTVVTVNSDKHKPIPGADFNQGLLRIWLGGRSRDVDLKNALLGIPPN